ncbi:MAG: MaoC family dehydratase N-terminal domain-containing protein [Chloroflexi bacterium]|uniref:MaoC family dehydratase N-terminal domain-containing protein n=1 Tax=Candidatus Chlorohelix allophototropha TaxID=3003348 RepID=A0A8T7LVD4_9CHLR|nr:MaoC family dehydratase N-terminal domain-containing protein [Chloroflexota bacterium]WJW67849.1 MaoC family dehydratase N-terminal domain-containing protein [Chloroflexota bacterium L227-S17]
MVNRELIGKVLSTYTFEIEKGKIREFVSAIGDPNPIYRSEEAAHAAGYPAIPVPPTFPTVVNIWGNNEGFSIPDALGVPSPRLLHGEEDYTYLAPVYAGDTITSTITLKSVEEKQGNTGKLEIILFEVVHTNQRGEEVLHGHQVVVAR